MADKTRYFRGVEGLTDGLTHYGEGDVFVGSPATVDFFERTGGKSGDRVLVEEISAADYEKAAGGTDPDAGADGDVVGTLPTGEDSLLDTQKGADGKPLKAATDGPDVVVGAPVPAEDAEESAPKKSTAKNS